MHRTHQHRTSIFGRRAFLLLLVSLLALLGSALSAGAFPGERFPSGFDRGKVFAEFASRVDGSLAEIRERRAPNALCPAGASNESAAARLEGGYGRFPLLFVKNEGQSAPEVAFTVHGSDKTLYFTSEGLAFSILVPRESGSESRGTRRLESLLEGAGKPREEREAPRERWTLKLGFVDAERVRPEGERPAETVISYFKGPKNEHLSGVSAYNSIVYRDLWPGIDLVYDGDANHLKYRFVVRPGADPKRIRLAYRGAERLSADAGGGLEIVTTAGVLRDAAPAAWQETEEGRVTVRAAYALGRRVSGSGEESLDAALDYGFSVGGYDPTKELIIDPVVLVYCGCIGGGSGEDIGTGVAVDGTGCAYVTGHTASGEGSFPEKVGPDRFYNGGAFDAFVAKVNAAGTDLEYCGYIGGTGKDEGFGIAVDASGNAYVTGRTSSSTDFPVLVGPDLVYNGGDFDAFVAKVNADGSGLAYCGYIGGSNGDTAEGIAVDAWGNAYVTGSTASEQGSFPVTEGPDASYNGGPSDVFVAKVNADGSGLAYCGYIGGTGDDFGSGIAVDDWYFAYVTGYTSSTEANGFPVIAWPDNSHKGGYFDVFAAKVNADGSGLAYCGYIGGTNADTAEGIAVDGVGCAYVTGGTASTKANAFPVTEEGMDDSYNGGSSDAFVAKVNAAGTGLTYCGYIGGTGNDAGSGIAVDGAGCAYMTGSTTSTNFPVSGDWPYSTYNGGSSDAFAAKVKADGTELTYCGYIGGSGDDAGSGIAVDAWGNAYVTGYTGSANFPVVAGWPDSSYKGGGFFDAFAAKITSHTGSVRVTIVGPVEARWSLDGVGSYVSGQTVPGVPVGVYVVSFSDVAGWDTPSDQNVVVSEDVTTETSGTYTATSTPTATPTPTPTPDPDPDPTPTPPPTPTPTPLPPVEPPVVPPDTPLPEGSRPSVPTPLVVTLPPNPTPEQKRDALWKVLSEALVPDERIESIIDLLTIDDAGRVYITEEGMERLGELLDDIDIPEGAEGSPLAVFRAVLDAQGSALTASDGVATAIVFFRIPEGFIGKRSDRLQVVKEISSKIAEAFERAYTLEDLRDGCAAVVEVETAAGVETLKRVLEADERISANCLVALAIKDGGRFDLDEKENGGVTDPAFIVEGVKKSDPDDPDGPSGSGGGCTAGGFSRTLLALFAPLVLLAGGRKRR